MKEVQGFVKALFLTGQNDLQSRDHEASEKEEQQQQQNGFSGPHRQDGVRPVQINRFKLNVQTNAVCVDILVWATKDEYGELGR